jgi:hypothetical protein
MARMLPDFVAHEFTAATGGHLVCVDAGAMTSHSLPER